VSVPPPGAKGQMNFTGLLGHAACAREIEGAANDGAASAAASRVRLFILFPPFI
jgi:hypothetical protein